MYKILFGGFSQETNSFSPVPADRNAFEKRRLFLGEEIFEKIQGEENEVNGYLDVLQKCPDVSLTPSIMFSAGPSGPVSRDVYDLAEISILNVIRENGPFDGILLNLHGAMVAQDHPDAEGDLLQSLRLEIGRDIPIFVTLDLHANITQKMVDNATVMLPCEKYPHTDCFELGKRSAELLLKTLRGDLKPVMAFASVPYLMPLFPTDLPPIVRFYQLADEIKRKCSLVELRIAHGFFPANIPGMGMAVLAVSNGDKQTATDAAKTLASAIWEGRESLKRTYTPLDDALDLAMSGRVKWPVVLGDGSDNPGAGGPCDTTHVLRSILQRRMQGTALAVICDPKAVQICKNAGKDAYVQIALGGHSDARLSGGPLSVYGKVVRFVDGIYRNRDEMEKGLLVNMGPSVVLDIRGNLVVVSSERCQVLDAEGFRSCGIDPEKQKVLIVKSAVHYRQSFGKFAGALVDLALPGYCAPDPDIFRSLGFHLG